MYALFKNNIFIKLVDEFNSVEYRIDEACQLYKIDASNLNYSLDTYKFVLDINHNLLIYLDESKVLTKSLWQRIKQFLGMKS